MNHNLPIVRCAGGPRERGRAHGAALRDQILATLERWRASLPRGRWPSPRSYVREFLAQTDYPAAMAQWTPDLLEEIQGIAEGAGAPPDDLLAYNLLDEEWWFGRTRAEAPPGCTAIGWRPAGGPPLLAQTMDIGSLYDGAQAVLRIIPDDGPPALVFTFAGMIGLNGCNAAGVGVVVNNLAMLPHAPRGLPVAALVRGILARPTLEAAATFVRAAPHASGQHYAVGGPGGVLSFEGWAGGVAEHTAAADRVLHTNHPLAVPGRPDERRDLSNSYARYQHIAARAATIDRQADVEALLADSTVPISIACVPGRGFTFGATSMALSSPPHVRVAPGPPHLCDYVELGFD
jgi:hypothetical protein